MSALLEILGRGVTHRPGDLLIEWLDENRSQAAATNQGPALVRLIDLLLAGRTESAETLVRSLYYADNVPVFAYLAGAALALSRNDLSQATADLEAVCAAQPSHTSALYALGFCHERQDRPAAAIADYQDCLKFRGHLELPAQRLAALYLKQQRYEAATTQYRRLADKPSGDIAPLLTLGHLHLAQHQTRDAIDAFSRAIMAHPDNLVFEDHDLDRHLQAGDFEEALAHVDGLLNLHPGRVDLLAKRGDILQYLGDTHQALAEYREAVTLAPNYIDACVKLGTLCARLGDFGQAAPGFSHALEIHERIIDAYLGLAQAHAIAEQRDQARAALQSAAMILPNSALLFLETARTVWYGLNAGPDALESDPHEAAVSVLHAHQYRLDTEPAHPGHAYHLGVCQLYLAGPGVAVHSFATAHQNHPTYARANAKLAICRYALGDADAALSLLRSQRCLSADTLSLCYDTALLYAEPVKFAGTLMNLSRSFAENWADVDPAAQVSVVLETLGITERERHTLDTLKETLALAGVPGGDEGDGFLYDDAEDW